MVMMAAAVQRRARAVRCDARGGVRRARRLQERGRSRWRRFAARCPLLVTALVAVRELASAALFVSDVYTDVQLFRAVQRTTKNETLCEDTCNFVCSEQPCHAISSEHSDGDCQ